MTHASEVAQRSVILYGETSAIGAKRTSIGTPLKLTLLLTLVFIDLSNSIPDRLSTNEIIICVRIR